MRKNQINSELMLKILATVPDDYDITLIDLRNNNLKLVLEYDLSEVQKYEREQAAKEFYKQWQEYVAECDRKLQETLRKEREQEKI